MKKAVLKERAKKAADLSRRLDTIVRSLNKLPKLAGKPALSDRVVAAQRRADNLRRNLEHDLSSPPEEIRVISE